MRSSCHLSLGSWAMWRIGARVIDFPSFLRILMTTTALTHWWFAKRSWDQAPGHWRRGRSIGPKSIGWLSPWLSRSTVKSHKQGCFDPKWCWIPENELDCLEPQHQHDHPRPILPPKSHILLQTFLFRRLSSRGWWGKNASWSSYCFGCLKLFGYLIKRFQKLNGKDFES